MHKPYCQIIEWRKDLANVQCSITGCEHLACILRLRGSAIIELITGEPKVPCPTCKSA